MQEIKYQNRILIMKLIQEKVTCGHDPRAPQLPSGVKPSGSPAR